MGGADRRQGADHVAADQLDEKLLQIKPYQLFSGKLRIFIPHQFFLIGVIHTSCKGMSGLLDNLRQKKPLRIIDLKNLSVEERDSGGGTGKGHDDKVRRDQTVGVDIVKFIGLVEDDISLF